MSAARPRRERLDQLLVTRGLAPTRNKAQALILAGQVSSEGQRLDKPGARCPEDIDLVVTERRRFVSRGGHKLAGALQAFDIAALGREALDVGASTGGFTQVLLEAGFARVAALDVGRGQLDWGLRNDPRVEPLEGKNARYLRPSDLPFVPRFAVVDVSFISLTLVLPAVVACLDAEGEIVALVKPQFEVGRRSVGKGGIVRDPALHRDVLRQLSTFARERGWGVVGLARSELPGADGNREFFCHVRPGDDGLALDEIESRIEALVEATS